MAETYSVEAVLTAVDKGMSSTLNGLQKAINGLQKTSSAFDTISNKSSSMFKSMLGANLHLAFLAIPQSLTDHTHTLSCDQSRLCL